MPRKTPNLPADGLPEGADAPETDDQAGSEQRKYRAPALEKGIDILELLARRGVPMTLTQISVELNRSVSELFRMVQSLEYKGYLAQSETGDGYVLTNRLFSLGMAQTPARTLIEAALPVMRQLSRDSMQSCHLVVLSDDQIVVVARIEAPGDLGFSVRVGYRRPAMEATSGVVIFAFQPDDIKRALLEQWVGGMMGGGRRRVEHFLTRAQDVRKVGFARSESDFVQGVVDLSAPVRGAYRTIAALTVPFVQRLPPLRTIEETIDLVRAAADEISADLATAD